MDKSPREFLSKTVTTVNKKLHTRRGQNLVLYLLCLVVAFIFWGILTLDETTERDYEVPVELINVPDSVVMISDIPRSVNVVLKGKGTQFVRYYFIDVPTMKIDFRQFSGSGAVRLSRSKIDSRLRDLFGQGVTIVSVNPDSIRLAYSSGTGYRVPLKVNAKIAPSSNSVVSGPIMAALDSVKIYTLNGEAPTIDFVETEVLNRVDLSDTLVCEVGIKKIPGVRVVPDRINVTVPVELLVSKKCSLPISTVNVPDDSRMITYPSTVEVSYLVPMRLSNQTLPAQAVIDYNNLNPESRYAPVSIESMPGGYKIVSVSQDSVEYVIER